MNITEEILSHQDGVFLLDLINAVSYCNDEERFKRLVEKLQYIMPYDFAICALASFGTTEKLSSYKTVNINYPIEWLSIYKERSYHEIDPIVREHFLSFKMQYWDDTYKNYRHSDEFKHHAENYGLSTGYTHGMRNCAGDEGSLFSFAGNSIEHNQRTEVIIGYLVPVFHEALTRIYGIRKRKVKSNLTLREREVLNWIKYGKNTWDISMILGISENTIKFHVKMVLEKLNAVNRTQAVAIAIHEKFIDLD